MAHTARAYALSIVFLFAACRATVAQFGGAESAKLKAAITGPATAVPGKKFDLQIGLTVEEGYHIQANTAKDPNIPTRVKVTAPRGFKVGAPVFPPAGSLEIAGETIPVFGGKLTVKVPITAPPKAVGKQSFTVKIDYQACNDASCLPPADTSASGAVAFAAAKPVKPLKKKAESSDIQSATYAQTSLFDGDHLTATTRILALTSGKPFDLTVILKVKQGFHIQAVDAKEPYIPTKITVTAPKGYQVGTPVFPPSTTATVAGDTIKVYAGEVKVRIPVTPPPGATGKPDLKVKVRYQACDDKSCFPPTEIAADSAPVTQHLTPGAAGSPNVAGFTLNKIEQFVPPDQFIRFLQTGKTAAGESGLGNLLAGNLLLALPVIFVLGLALNLTPCVYPIIPITISYFGGQSESGQKPLTLAIFYVLGMALMYSILGVVAGLTGNLFGSQLQNPWVLAVFALIMFALALSQFDRPDGTPIWEFQLPSGLRNRVQRKSGLVGAVLMGLMVGVVAAPCIGPAVIALLQFVGTQKSPGLGFVVFFTLALGLGLPYVFLATISGSVKKLPRSGEWMIGVKHIFGAILIWMGFFYLQTILNGWYSNLGTYLLVAVAAISGIYLLFLDRSGANARGFHAFRRILGAAAILVGIWLARPAPPETIQWQPYSEEKIQQARSDGKKVLVDFTAAWCAQCKELEHKTFSDPRVGKEAGDFVALRADMTNFEGPTAKKWQAAYGIRGLPTVARLIPNGESASAR